MEFRYRYVEFGTVFVPSTGVRGIAEGQRDRTTLFENELALDVGGVCWGYADERHGIIDHHFFRPGQFPSAAAAVIHSADRIRNKFSKSTAEVMWLVTHRQTDFDAFCSMYLARSLVEDSTASIDWESLGISASGWLDGAQANGSMTMRKLDWFAPDLNRIPADQRSRVLLAAYASCVDNSRRLRVRKNRALHSVLYAALQRGRDYFNEKSGATEFFQRVEDVINTKGLNPLYDSVLENDPVFAPELSMLDREVEAYERDISRSRKVIVHLQKTPQHFDDFFPDVRSTLLLDADLMPRSEHVAPPGHTRSQADGVYLRDPECLLFKEWARLDLENSSMGLGFLFTAVAYSDGRSDAEINRTDYFFAIDPERADGRHLYAVWARLQSAEIRALHQAKHASLKRRLEEAESLVASTLKGTNCRSNFQKRAGPYSGLFDDPWFDGSNYRCTIVATPNRGTLIGEAGVRADLLDDPVATIVQAELEYSIYCSAAALEDLPASREHSTKAGREFDMANATTLAPPPSGHFRVGHVELDDNVNLTVGSMAAQIGGAIWRVVNPDMEGTPVDFFSRHLFINPDWLGVWSRRGVVLAHKRSAREAVAAIEDRFRSLTALAKDVDVFVSTEAASALESVKQAEELTRRAAKLEHDLVLPENRILSRFFEAIRLGEVLNTLRAIHGAAAERVRNEKLDQQTAEFTRHTATVADVQTKVEWLEVFFVGFYATELSRILTELLGFRHDIALVIVVLVGAAFTAAAALALAPWHHGRSRRVGIILLLLALLWILGLLARSYVHLV